MKIDKKLKKLSGRSGLLRTEKRGGSGGSSDHRNQ